MKYFLLGTSSLILTFCVFILTNDKDEIPAVEEEVIESIEEQASEFIVVHSEITNHVHGGYGLSVIVHKSTRVQYMLTEKPGSNYGGGLEVLIDEEGNPLLYEGEL